MYTLRRYLVTLEVRPSNRAASVALPKTGLCKIGQRKRYYADGEDALILELANLIEPHVWQPLAEQLAILDAQFSGTTSASF